jgi:xanthine/uracil permease
MQFGEIFEGLGMIFGLIIGGIVLVIGCCLVAAEFSDIGGSWKEASDREKKWTKICCGSCTLMLMMIAIAVLLSM